MEVGSRSTGVCASVVKSTLDNSHFLMEVAGSGPVPNHFYLIQSENTTYLRQNNIRKI